MTTKKTKSTSLRALPVPFEAEGYLEVGVSFCRGIGAKDGQITSPIWGAATCRRYAPGIGTTVNVVDANHRGCVRDSRTIPHGDCKLRVLVCYRKTRYFLGT